MTDALKPLWLRGARALTSAAHMISIGDDCVGGADYGREV